jgi:hypothetical protein
MGRDGREFDVRLRQALALLEARGLGKSTYAPPLFRLLWKLGVSVPPPHMAGFAFNSLLMGGFFGVFWSLLMWLMLWGRQGMSLLGAATTALVAGGLFGLAMGWYMRSSARKRAIPRWQDFIRE